MKSSIYECQGGHYVGQKIGEVELSPLLVRNHSYPGMHEGIDSTIIYTDDAGVEYYEISPNKFVRTDGNLRGAGKACRVWDTPIPAHAIGLEAPETVDKKTLQ